MCLRHDIPACCREFRDPLVPLAERTAKCLPAGCARVIMAAEDSVSPPETLVQFETPLLVESDGSKPRPKFAESKSGGHLDEVLNSVLPPRYAWLRAVIGLADATGGASHVIVLSCCATMRGCDAWVCFPSACGTRGTNLGCSTRPKRPPRG